jgi:hypothetical protein
MLSSVVQVEKVSDFEFELVDPSPDDFDIEDMSRRLVSPKRIVGWSIFNLEAQRWKEEQEWISGFETHYGISLQRIIEGYNTCLSRGRNRVAENRARYLATELQRENVRISAMQISNIIARLKKGHPHYGELLED